MFNIIISFAFEFIKKKISTLCACIFVDVIFSSPNADVLFSSHKIT